MCRQQKGQNRAKIHVTDIKKKKKNHGFRFKSAIPRIPRSRKITGPNTGYEPLLRCPSKQLVMVVVFSGHDCVCSDPFADDNEGGGSNDGHIHIRIQQRNGRKTLTTVQGIRPDYDLKKIVKACKKVRYHWIVKACKKVLFLQMWCFTFTSLSLS